MQNNFFSLKNILFLNHNFLFNLLKSHIELYGNAVSDDINFYYIKKFILKNNLKNKC